MTGAALPDSLCSLTLFCKLTDIFYSSIMGISVHLDTQQKEIVPLPHADKIKLGIRLCLPGSLGFGLSKVHRGPFESKDVGNQMTWFLG